MDDLTSEYVLVQAWKKASGYIRNHNWFSDTLELDQVTANLPRFLRDLARDLRAPVWIPDPIRLVPAPKGQKWEIDPDSGKWQPCSGGSAVKLRPLAHVSIRDQVAATALMICLADRVETAQYDPRPSADGQFRERSVVSYGNRLFCDRVGESLRHRWGSSKLFRAYFHDYQSFLNRPEVVAGSLDEAGDRVVIVQSDLQQFYDRVRPRVLYKKVLPFLEPNADPQFARIVRQVFNWRWARSDASAAEEYAQRCSISNFSSISLPQGLVAAGFFANAVLSEFDTELRNAGQSDISRGMKLHDAIRYVDDVRLVLTVDPEISAEAIQAKAISFLTGILRKTAPGLRIARDKTSIAYFRGDNRTLLRQSRKMARIQRAVSGGFDAAEGEAIIDAVQGLIRTQERFSLARQLDESSQFLPVPDVRDETVGRFSAVRFRTTYRSLRPLLAGESSAEEKSRRDDPTEVPLYRSQLTREALDDEARAYALTLINSWIRDPSNVRMLRIGLDMWPSAENLRQILQLIRPYTSGAGRGRARKVALYCLSEIFRAGATETGFVADDECLPNTVDLSTYRSELLAEAHRLISLPATSLPWYLKQQVLLYVAALDPAAPALRPGRRPETTHYRRLIRFIGGEFSDLSSSTFATLAVIARRSFLPERAAGLVAPALTRKRLKQIARRDPEFATELLTIRSDLQPVKSEQTVSATGFSLHELVLETPQPHALRQELGVLSFAISFVTAIQRSGLPESLTPRSISINTRVVMDHMVVESLEFTSEAATSEEILLYAPPTWVDEDRMWKVQLGYLLRFILTARADFTRSSRTGLERNLPYRPMRSHWYQREYAFYNGHEAFGDDWLPVSAAVEDLLFGLLAWPGCRDARSASWLKEGLDTVLDHLKKMFSRAQQSIGPATRTLILRVPAPTPADRKGRPLRGCIIQTITPDQGDFSRSDLTFSRPEMRAKHRNHLSTALSAVVKLMQLRDTHRNRGSRLDWLILPELSVHPRDVQTHLIPFARQHRTIILAGLTYEQVIPGHNLINSALWVIPRTTSDQGLKIITRRQGKLNLASEEQAFNQSGVVIEGFRPAQWVVDYEWSDAAEDSALSLTSAICYDATDLRLASDLRGHTDVFAIPALNRDVNTFDNMAAALHYHMYQMVVIANNGQFGGSNAYWPKRDSFVRQVFHLHGQPQATLSFFEIDEIGEMKARVDNAKGILGGGSSDWKFPPAGL